ncbi:MAG: ACT domain-containing protein [Candidatus Thermoplasmatota archaeon]
MWKYIAKHFQGYPTRKKIAQKMLKYGLKTKKNKIYCGNIQLSDSKIAKALNIDRRAVKSTTEHIQKKPELKKIFENLRPTSNLKEIAPEMKWGIIEIIPDDPSQPGILAEIAKIIAENHISIRQAISDDFEITEQPKLFVVTDKTIPSEIIPKIKKAKGVKAVLIY